MIKSYKLFLESKESPNPPLSEVAAICEKYGINNWSINKEGLVDVKGSVNLGIKD